jgi:hypothetical protein
MVGSLAANDGSKSCRRPRRAGRGYFTRPAFHAANSWS